MLNFVPKSHPSVSLLFGKRPLQRVVCGTQEKAIDIPLDAVAPIPAGVDQGTSYVGNKYNALPWEKFIDIKIDAANLIDSNVKTALTNLQWFPQVQAVFEGQKAQTEIGVSSGRHVSSFKYTIAPQ